MSRLKVRVNPEFGSGLRPYIEKGVKGIVVSVAIDEKGNVTVKEVAADPRIANALKAAVGQWKFNPTIIDNQPRCVEADLPITLTPP
jgi:outer membrane biosynthesis protein TonB